MRKIIFIASTILLFTMVSCASQEQKACEKIIKECLVAPSTYKCISFELTEEVTLKNEIDDRIKYLTETTLHYDSINIEMAIHDIEFAQEMIDFNKKYNIKSTSDEEELKEKEDVLANEIAKKDKDLYVIELLNNLYIDKKEQLNDVTFKTYELKYTAKNALNVPLQSYCLFRINQLGEIVAFKHEDEYWTLLGKFFSIEEYYYAIEE